MPAKVARYSKNPITDDGTKKSAKGLLRVTKTDDGYALEDQVSWEEEKTGAFREVYRDGQLLIDDSLSQIRGRIAQSIQDKQKQDAMV